MTALTEFIERELIPSLFENIDKAFPLMEFKRRGKVWNSPKHLNGADSSDGQGSYISEKLPNRIADRNGSASLSLIDFKAQEMGLAAGVRGEALLNVIKELCSVCGLSVPEGDAEKYREYKERQEELLRLSDGMKAALFQPEGAEVLRYLKEQRGYSEELIKKMNLGLLTEEAEEALFKLGLLGYYDEQGQLRKGNTRKYYSLTIPYIAGGSVKGFKFRIIKPETGADGKPLSKYRNTNGLIKRLSLFGISGANLTGSKEERDITIVEGELDALRAQAEGLSFVVAATGGELFPEQIAELREKGAHYITLLFDTEQKGSKAEKDAPAKIEKALKVIREGGLRAYVCELPSESGEKVDVDSYLAAHSAEELRLLIKDAIPEAVYRFFRLRDAAIEENGGEGAYCPPKNMSSFKSSVIRLTNESYILAEDRSYIFRLFSDAVGSFITAEDIEQEADKIKAEEEQIAQERETKALNSKAEELIKAGKIEAALSLMQSGSERIKNAARESSASRYLKEDIDGLFEEYKAQTQGTETNIELSFKDGKTEERYRFTLPSGALTIIGGATGHGKSRLLQSLALNVAENSQEGIVLYITYEENRKNVNRQLLNAYADIDLTTGNNEQTLKEFLRDGRTRFIKKEALPEFLSKLSEFKELRRTKLRLIKPEDDTLETLEDILRAAFKDTENPVKAVFVDYVQEIYLESPKKNLQRTEELRSICVELDLIAQKEDVPFILAAQLKADVESPLTMRNQDIADSVNIPRKASEVLLLWSSAELPPKDKDGVEERKIREKLPELHIGERGTLYIKLTKSRLLPKGSEAFLTINGNTGRVKGNATEPTAHSLSSEQSPQPEQGSLFTTK